MRIGWLAVAVAATGCGDNRAAAPDALTADALALVEGANRVTFETYGEPVYIAYRNGASGWGTPRMIEPGSYELLVDDTYEVIVVCGGFPVFESELHARRFSDGDTDYVFCFSDYARAPVPQVTVDMQVSQPAHVWMYSDAESEQGPWTFSVDIPSGTHDMVGVDTSHRMVVRRDLDVSDNVTLAPLDFIDEGTPMREHAFRVYGETASDVITADLTYVTPSNYVIVEGTSDTLYAPPANLLTGSDYARWYIEVRDDATSRSISMETTTSLHDFQVLPLIDQHALVFSVPDNRSLRGDWTQLPEFDELEVALYGYVNTQYVSVTRGWVEATQRKWIEFATPYDFLPEWRVDLRSPYYRYVSIDRTSDGVSYGTSRFDEITNVLGN